MTRYERLLPALRVGFLGAVGVFAWVGLRGRFGEIRDALADTSPLAVIGALLLVLVGLVATSLVWRRLMDALGAHLPVGDGLATFFVGQLGKYIPGSVWSIGAQAQMAARHEVPARSTAGAGLLFLGYHLATGVVVGAVAVLSGRLDASWPTWVTVLALVGALVGMTPPVVAPIAGRLAKRAATITVRDTAYVLGLMTVAWAAYSGALVLLVPDRPWSEVVAIGGAFAIAYAVGVVVVVAPAGVGARETVFVLLLTPMLTVPGATALALLARVVHTAADGIAALVAWRLGSAHRRDRVESREPAAGQLADPGDRGAQLG